QVVAHQQADLAHEMRGGVQKQVEGPGDHTFDRIFDTHNAELRAARGGGVEDFIEVGAVDNVGGATKEFDGGLLAEGALGPQNGDALGRLECQAGRHDLTPDGSDMGAFEGARV